MEAWARRELVGARLPDKRYLTSICGIAERLAQSGATSYSEAVGHAGRQAARRLFDEEETSVDGLLQGHYQQTGVRCAEHRLVLAVQDTTALDYTQHKSKQGLGPIDSTGRTRGLLVHSVLAVSPEGQPLGLLDVNIWARDPQTPKTACERRRTRKTADKESAKWLRGLQRAQAHVPAHVPLLVVQDREGDVFAFMAAKRHANTHLLVRAAHPRNVRVPHPEGEEAGHLMEMAACAPVVAHTTVQVARQANRPEREATLTLRSTLATILPPRHQSESGEKHAPQELYLIDAREECPPEGQTPLHWVLVSSLPVMTADDAVQMLHYYTVRWTIERLHYVLKSGCVAERLQIDDHHRLLNALAIYYLVAWRILAITYEARTSPEASSSTILRDEEAQALAAATNRPVGTVAQAVLAIAILGGHEHYKNAPHPGPKRLWAGLRRLEGIVLGWTLATRAGPHYEPR